MEKILIIGASGHGKVIADAVRASPGQELFAFADRSPLASEYLGRPVLREDDTLPSHIEAEPSLSLVVGIGDNAVREEVVTRLEAQGLGGRFATVRHPSAVISDDVVVGEGTVVLAGAIANPGTTVGRHCILNTSCSVDHDCDLGDFASVAPGATLGGGVRLGPRSAVSLGASVMHGVTIGGDTVVGAGALVRKDLPEEVVAYGVPARVVRSRERGERYL